MIEEHLQEILDTPPLALDEILSARERRADTQRQLLEEGQGTLICLTLNIAGAVKSAPLFTKAFEEGKSRILTQLRFERAEIGKCIERHERTGDDIDVMAKGVPKISRQQLGLPPRRCLVCGEMAAACARSRRHDIREILRRTVELIDGYFVGEYADRVAGHACRALLYEVHIAPKPGLVDRENSGAHRDMDEFTFFDSACALYPYFRECAKKGALYREEPDVLFALLRMDGKLAEQRMLRATGGVNTHKGAIFSMGIFCAVMGSMMEEGFGESAFAARCKALCRDLLRDFEGLEQKENISYGERLYRDYGITGIRGEAAEGFPSVLQVGLPALREGSEAGKSLNDAALLALLRLIQAVQDTNILTRSDPQTLQWAQQQAGKALEQGAGPEQMRELDRAFTACNLSPGGCADLLALSLFLFFMGR